MEVTAFTPIHLISWIRFTASMISSSSNRSPIISILFVILTDLCLYSASITFFEKIHDLCQNLLFISVVLFILDSDILSSDLSYIFLVVDVFVLSSFHPMIIYIFIFRRICTFFLSTCFLLFFYFLFL